MEHRETRNHWLSEKSELESRTFQMLALQTQIQGTMRKKEKDYEKLQGQLDKVVRDSMRGNKAAIIVSKPLQKNSSQTKITGTLIDAELTAAKSIISLLQVSEKQPSGRKSISLFRQYRRSRLRLILFRSEKDFFHFIIRTQIEAYHYCARRYNPFFQRLFVRMRQFY